ncbi:MAG UNVERIFIED_CONTAM: hypothetical protein LVR18_31740 [Planctomycetaceae bacterium]
MLRNLLSRFRHRWLDWHFVRFQRELEEAWFGHASSSGRPRGLRWSQCRWLPDRLLLRERQSGQWWMLRSVSLSFEAIEGGGMEDVAAVSSLRDACAVFVWSGRSWRSGGRALFNMDPAAAARHLEESHDVCLEVRG